MATKNYAAAAGLGVLKHKRAIGFGFLGSIALATILSKPDDLIGPGSALIERSRIKITPSKAANRMKPETLLPQGQQLGDPSAPTRLSVPTAHIAPGGDSVRVSVNARTRANMDHNELVSRLRIATGRNSTLNLPIRDNSQTLNIHALANKLL